MATTAKKINGTQIPSPHDWRTTDDDEVNKRRLRARQESFTISNLDPQHPVFSNFRVASGSGLTYSVEIRDVRQRQFACGCVDFRTNGLGTCKHVEAVLLHLAARFRRLFKAAQQNGSNRIEVVVDSNADTLRMHNGHGELPDALQKWFDAEGNLASPDLSGECAITALKQLREAGFPQIRISQEVAGWLENRRRAAERKQLRREYELKQMMRDALDVNARLRPDIVVLDEETRTPLQEAIHNLARALAVENRLPGPASLDDAVLPPLSQCWNEALPLLRSFVAEAAQPWKPVADALDKMAPARNA